MTQEEIEMLVLTDQEGNVYLLSRETLDAARVPDERKAEVLAAGGDDASGYAATGYAARGTYAPSLATLSLHRIVLYPKPQLPGPGPVEGIVGPRYGQA
jgi:hypothetical protein